MPFKDKLPVSYLLFTNRGRINRRTYWTVSLFIWTSFYILYNLLELISISATLIVYPLLFWALIATATKRLHDTSRSAHWLWLVAIPVIGPLILIWFLGFRKGKVITNRFGDAPGSAPDYFKNPEAEKIIGEKTEQRIVDDVTKINPVIVSKVESPTTIEELQSIIKKANGAISIGGGRFSMGGQTASAGSIHIDMRKLNRVLSFSKEDKTIKVEAGIRWCDIQRFIDEHGLSIKIMQTYSNFTVGGAISVNCHGRYIGLGPVILWVRSIEIIMANGTLVKASKDENAELFFCQYWLLQFYSCNCYSRI